MIMFNYSSVSFRKFKINSSLDKRMRGEYVCYGPANSMNASFIINQYKRLIKNKDTARAIANGINL